jgi:TPR repeat protein
MSGNYKCPFCNSDRSSKTVEEDVHDMMKRVGANDAASINLLGNQYQRGKAGFPQDHAKAMELYSRAAELGFSKAHNNLANVHHEGGNMKKAKFHFEAAAMAGNEWARYNLGILEAKSGNMERTVKHWNIAASAGCYDAMHEMRIGFEKGAVSRESIDSTLAAYNSSCAEMRSEARDAIIRIMAEAEPRL